MAHNMMKKSKNESRTGEHDKIFFAGIRAKDDRRQLIRSKRAGLRNVGIVWDCSVLCLARCGPRIYAGPL